MFLKVLVSVSYLLWRGGRLKKKIRKIVTKKKTLEMEVVCTCRSNKLWWYIMQNVVRVKAILYFQFGTGYEAIRTINCHPLLFRASHRHSSALNSVHLSYFIGLCWSMSQPLLCLRANKLWCILTKRHFESSYLFVDFVIYIFVLSCTIERPWTSQFVGRMGTSTYGIVLKWWNFNLSYLFAWE